ncbi:MAG: protein-disulfide reductase DsbD domain-containing protein [Hyphomicrobium sp.]
MKWRNFLSLALMVLTIVALSAPTASSAADGLSSGWAEGHNSRVRLIAGKGLAGVELQMPEGWKTYWRSPGDAGGVPPSFDWSKSENLASAQVLYPAPKRFTDSIGDTVGYKNMVVFPVRLEAKDPTKPIGLRLALDYGVCKEICIPADAVLALDIAADAPPVPRQLAAALERVPQSAGEKRASDPVLKRVVVELTGERPLIVLETEFPGGGAHADAFVEAPSGIYVPLPKKTADDGAGNVTFEIDLSSDVDVEDLQGQLLIATLVSDEGQSEVTFDIR